MDKSVTTRVWVSRIKNYSGAAKSYYVMWLEKPTPRTRDDGTVWFSGTAIETFCPKHFHRMTPIRLKPGTYKQFDLTISAIEVKE